MKHHIGDSRATWVTGLSWLHFDERPNAKAIATSFSTASRTATYTIVELENGVLVGVADEGIAANEKARPLAAALAAQFGDLTVYATLPSLGADDAWVCMIRNGTVSMDAIMSREQARDFLADLPVDDHALPFFTNFGNKKALQEFSFTNTIESALLDEVSNIDFSAAPFKAIKQTNPLHIVVLLGAVLGVGYYGYASFFPKQSEQASTNVEAIQISENALRLAMEQEKSALAELLAHAATKPRIDTLVSFVLDLRTHIAGYQINTIKFLRPAGFNDGVATVTIPLTFKPGVGAVFMPFVRAAKTHNIEVPLRQTSLETIESVTEMKLGRTALRTVQPEELDKLFSNSQIAHVNLVSRLQRLARGGQIGWTVGEASPVARSEPIAGALPDRMMEVLYPYTARPFSIEGKGLWRLRGAADILNGYSTIVLDSVSLMFADDYSWRLEGQLYATP